MWTPPPSTPIHLAPYRAAIDAGARIVMASFSSTAAGKVHGDRHLLTDVLKGELGFTGFVVSDWAGVDQVDADYTAAVAQSISAGIDMVMVPSDGPRFADAVRAGPRRRHDRPGTDRRRGDPDPAGEVRARPVRGADAGGDGSERGRVGRAPGARPRGRRAVRRPAPDDGRRAAAGRRRHGPAGRLRRGRHRSPVGRLDHHVAGERRSDHAGHDHRGRARGTTRRSPRALRSERRPAVRATVSRSASSSRASRPTQKGSAIRRR